MQHLQTFAMLIEVAQQIKDTNLECNLDRFDFFFMYGDIYIEQEVENRLVRLCIPTDNRHSFCFYMDKTGIRENKSRSGLLKKTLSKDTFIELLEWLEGTNAKEPSFTDDTKENNVK